MLRLAPIILVIIATAAAAQQVEKPKLGLDAIPIYENLDYLRHTGLTDYWRMSAFFVPQISASGSSVAAAATAINMLNGLPGGADEPLLDATSLLKVVANRKWSAEVTADAQGVSFQGLKEYLRDALNTTGLHDATLAAVAVTKGDSAELDALRLALEANERSSGNAMIVYFDRGVATGDWDGPHVSPVGAYDRANDLVLIMDVDRKWQVPYWTPAATLLVAMAKPISAEFGALAGGTGGYYTIAR